MHNKLLVALTASSIVLALGVVVLTTDAPKATTTTATLPTNVSFKPVTITATAVKPVATFTVTNGTMPTLQPTKNPQL